MKNTAHQNELLNLWETLEKTFFISLAKNFSNRDAKGWLSHFVQNQKINIYQHGKGENGKAKMTKIYNGGLFPSLLRGRMSASFMAKAIFKDLAKVNYSHTEGELLGIDKKSKNKVVAYIRYKRFNTSGKVFESAISLYTLIRNENEWRISQMDIHDNNKETLLKVNLAETWNPNK